MANVAFLGLGVMGYPMAGHLQSAGHSVTVYNRTTAGRSLGGRAWWRNGHHSSRGGTGR